MEGSEDLRHARVVADELKSKHTEIIFTPQQGFAAIKHVIRDLESYDITTIRASVGMWWAAKWIKENTEDILISEPTKVLEGGTGFMMITRSAFEKFKDAYPENSYYPDHIRTKNFDGESEIHMYFQALLSTEDDGKKRYLSEDYMFCQWMDKAGVDTWICPWMKLNHTGAMMFGGSLSDIAELGVAPTADSSKIVKK